MNEKLIEKKLREEIRKLGGRAEKFIPTYFVGAPDRLILMSGGKVYWVETKSTGDKLRDIQQTRKKQLEKLGFKVYKVDSQQALDRFIKDVRKDAI
ncbi:VRR-NUC domain-containing protein [Vallitalea sp.]|jgi:hypothetical protein|uniref:VRR-NUC domain-containing protein n=1 Tax=Vallitalea sp. TaxID=1882829 RepID=UPI0025DBD526|nr:VRR-NUC domain-containing protein [Vallitalea sp.]MCT4686066.1 VRR-NUC domain-containing protein [Vallitalea sp.]